MVILKYSLHQNTLCYEVMLQHVLYLHLKIPLTSVELLPAICYASDLGQIHNYIAYFSHVKQFLVIIGYYR